MEVGGIEPHTRVVGQGLTPYCDQIVTVFYGLGSLHFRQNAQSLIPAIVQASPWRSRYWDSTQVIF